MAYGMSNILVYGSIFNGPRNFINKWGSDEHAPFNQFAAFVASMLKCMMCTSTWVGFAYGLGVWSPTNQLFEVTPYSFFKTRTIPRTTLFNPGHNPPQVTIAAFTFLGSK